jgi:hypothetical protein
VRREGWQYVRGRSNDAKDAMRDSSHHQDPHDRPPDLAFMLGEDGMGVPSRQGFAPVRVVQPWQILDPGLEGYNRVTQQRGDAVVFR